MCCWLLLQNWGHTRDNWNAWRLERRIRNQKVTQKDPDWERINVHIVKSGPKSAPGRRLEVTLRSCLLLGEIGFAPLPKPRPNLRVEGKLVDFMLDTGAQNSMLLSDDGLMTDSKTWVQDATRIKPCSWTTQRTMDLWMDLVIHSFLVIPECPFPQLGCHLLTKMNVQIHFSSGGPKLLNEDGKSIHVLVTRSLKSTGCIR